jgi:hypothetical protein
MFKLPSSGQTSDRELRSLTDDEMELVSGGAINPYPTPRDTSNDANAHYDHPGGVVIFV